MPIFSRPIVTRSRIKNRLLVLSTFLSLTLLFYLNNRGPALPAAATAAVNFPLSPPPPPLSVHDLLFSIASSSSSLPRRIPYIRLWCDPISAHNNTFIFLDRPTTEPTNPSSIPPIVLSSKSSPNLPSGYRIALIVKDAVTLDIPNIHWYVFGDDDTVFFTENLVRILSKYDHNRWYYIGYGSESFEQNDKFFFNMAFGGGGFAISAPLARVLARVLDSCLDRYPHLYGSDARIFACLSELGVGLTPEPGFHQVDVRGNLFGFLAAHPLSPLLSLHHMEAVEPIFPGMSRIQSLEHLFKAIQVDPAKVLQQTVCYDHTNSLTISIAWGYAVQIYEGNKLLLDILSLQKSFRPWRRGKNVDSSHYMFNTREFPRDPCKRPAVFFMDTVVSDTNQVWTSYTKRDVDSCVRLKAIEKLKVIRVLSPKLDFDIEQLKTPRRHCCDISPSFDEKMVVQIRQCGMDELVTMRT
ncbi:ATP-dependent DNA ligase ykoU [Olea europaea subsp. europaea]|uniref:ATP-dependent DNA ligase ykoU n=1 Tax=Olea europaea subsp. europaea TaxID=158383 RepID=A0A8S0RMP2_OLEEU|nr:ATP-dependent DNA ligase ykoU [Olea europaea subsp. europaea]